MKLKDYLTPESYDKRFTKEQQDSFIESNCRRHDDRRVRWARRPWVGFDVRVKFGGALYD